MRKAFTIEKKGITTTGEIISEDLSKKSPAVIISHEYAASMKSTFPYAAALSKFGFHCFIFDFPGSGTGKSTGRSSLEMTVITEKEDLSTVLDYVKEQSFVDSDRIILMGCSQGGFVSALLAAERENEIEKLILNYPALCICDDCRKGSILGTEIDVNNIPEDFTAFGVHLSPKYVHAGAALEPWKEMCTFKKPVLILHGNADKIVNISYSETAAKKYPDAKLTVIDGADHHYVKPAHFNAAVMAIEEFLK